MFSCHICGVEFARRDILSRHLKRKIPCNTQNRKICCDKHDSSSIYKLNHMKRSDSINTKSAPTFDGTDFDNERSHQDEEGRKTSSLNDFQHIGHGYSYGDQYNNATDSDDKDDETESKEDEEEMFEPLPKDDIATYTWHDDGSTRKNHTFLLPSNVRLIIVGKSGCGKTTVMTHLLMAPDVMDYNKLLVCGRSLHQPEYKIMQQGFSRGLSKDQVASFFWNQRNHDKSGIEYFMDLVRKRKGGVDASFFEDVNMIPDPSEHDPSHKTVLVLDDVMLGPQNKAEAYFTRGRHNNVDVIYITQSYFRLPRQTIRENSNMFIIFMQDRKNLVHIYNDHCAGDGIPFDDFSNFCNAVWRENQHNFITIDLS